ncbi:hypothetical protein SUDANB58_04234 [Streptomyces sp. enrichment culture]
MGFTVTGPCAFLAGGHPSPAGPDAASPHLGSVRSTDAGRAWSVLHQPSAATTKPDHL